jgi:pimeloyl-ACP methyl ester carboxylesterase
MRPRSRRCALAAVGALIVLTGCTGSVISGQGRAASRSKSSSASSLPPAPTPSPANFQDCSTGIRVNLLGLPASRLADLSFECARISVPLDYADASGKQIPLFLLRIHDANDTSPIGSLLVNPGGPGGSGVNLALGLLKKLPPNIPAHFDLVGFDPRGVGLSSPVDCLSDAQEQLLTFASPDVLTAHGFGRAKGLAKIFASDCTKKYGAALADYNTVQTARDMDQIRQAVGDDKLNYLGFSYGTELGAQYVHLFPQRVRVAVLDGAVDPLYGPIETAAKQLKGFEDGFDQFANWCAAHDPCGSIGNPRQAVANIVAATQRKPLSATGTGRIVSTNLALIGVAEALYSRSDWPTLGRALVSGLAGDGRGLLDLSDQYYQRFNGHYTNLFDAFNTVTCNDSPPGPSDATIKTLARRWTSKYPIFGAGFAVGLFTCQQWQPKRTVPPPPTAPNSAHTVLVIGNVHDPATPYQGAKDLTNTLGNARLLTWNGEGHTSYLEGSSCIDNYVDAYLIQGTLPAAGTKCR